MTWRFVERVTVRRVGAAFIGEARTHAIFATGKILPTPEAAMASAAAKLSAEIGAKNARVIAKKPPPPAHDEFEGLL
jgi:hypothetical protein